MDGGGANDFNEGEELRDEDAPNENFNCDSNTNNITGTTQENSSTNAQLYNLSVPAAAEFDTALLLFHYCQSHAKLNGYAASIKNGISPSSVILVATIEQVEKQNRLKIEGRL
jgi:hypothetical protein